MAQSRPGARLGAAAMAFLLPVVYSPSLSAQAWTPRAALALVLAALGLPRLVAAIRSGARPAAVAAGAFVVVAALATALSAQPVLSLFGLYNWGTGLLFIAGLAGAWGLGVSVDAGGVDLVERALLAAVLVNALVALVQGAFSLNVSPLTRYEGRAAGLLSNPVHLATLTAGGLALVVPRVRGDHWRYGAATVLVAAALELSGSRFALVLAVVVAVVMVVRHRRAAVAGVGALVLGLLFGVAIGALGGATTGNGRVQAGGETVGVSARLRVWASAGHAVSEHPVLGAGPGRFRAATSPYRTLGLVRAEAPDRLFVDGHNVLVEYATTTGLVGVAAFVVWLALACRRSRGRLLGFFLLVLAMHLVAPQFVGTTPVALLALGVAGRAELPAFGRTAMVASFVVAIAALVAAGRLVWGDYELNNAVVDFRASSSRAAVAALPPWPEPAEAAGRVALFDSITTQSPQARRDALRWDRLAARRDPTDPLASTELAEAELYLGRPVEARRSFEHALLWDPWSVRALNGLANAALAGGERAAARRALQRSLQADPAQPKVRTQLRELQ